MPIRVWKPTPPTPSITTTATIKKPHSHQPTPKPAPTSTPLTADQRKRAKRREENRIVFERANGIYRALQEGRPADEIIAQGFEAKWVYRYLLIHARKYRLWRQAVALFEAGVPPEKAMFQLDISPTKCANWYIQWKEHGPGLPVVIPTGCEGIE